MIEAIEILLLLVMGFFFSYLALLSLLALTQRGTFHQTSKGLRELAIIIPAHNEEEGIEQTVRNLFQIDYPRDLFSVIVVADNCTDGTMKCAGRAGATVLERVDPLRRGKGYALRWVFDRLVEEGTGYDALVVVDADSVVSKNLLMVLNEHLERGAEVIQCSDVVAPRPGVWSSEITRVGFLLYNIVRPLGRRALRCSAGLRGNGMCFTVDLLRRIPWCAFSQAEDLEYGLMLLMNNVPVIFAPEASVVATMPTDAKNAESQRARWEIGRLPLIRKYGRLLATAAVVNGSYRAFDGLVDLVTPPFVNLFAFSGAMFFVTLLLWLVGVVESGLYVFLWSSVLGMGLAHVLVGLWVARADRQVYRALLFAPRYAFWKIFVYAKVIWNGHAHQWIRTTREKPLGGSSKREVCP